VLLFVTIYIIDDDLKEAKVPLFPRYLFSEIQIKGVLLFRMCCCFFTLYILDDFHKEAKVALFAKIVSNNQMEDFFFRKYCCSVYGFHYC